MTESKVAGFLRNAKQDGEKPPPGSSDLRTSLERELEAEDTELGNELRRTRAEEIIARRRLAIAAMRGAQGAPDTGGGKASERGKEWLTDLVQRLLERGLDEKRVGNLVDYLLGTAQPTAFGFPSSPAPAQGITLTDVFSIQDRMNANKPNSELDNIIREIREEIKSLKNQPKGEKVDPVAAQVSAFESLGNLVDSLVKLGVVQRPGTGVAVEGEPLEVVKEKNSFELRKMEIEGENAYKQSKGAVLHKILDIPKDLGADISERILGREQASEESSTMEYRKCSNGTCDFNIPYPPDAVTATCPKCGMIYDRSKKGG